jgi:hypothetical protein
LWTAGARRPDDAAIDDLVDRLIAQRESIATQLAALAGVARAAAERNFDVLGELLANS